MQSFPIIYPHRVLTYLFDHVGVWIDPASVNAYWDHARAFQDPWCLQHAYPDCRDVIPLGLHGDGARLWVQHRTEKCFAITMNMVLFRPVSTRHSRFVLFSIPVELLYKNRTLNCVWKRLVWSLNACYEGYYPATLPNGTPVHGPRRFVTRQQLRFCISEIRGDWEFHRDMWRPTAAWNSIQICMRCPAMSQGQKEYLYWNNEDSAKWPDEVFGVNEFVARRLKQRNLCSMACNQIACCLFFGLALKP